MTIDSRNGPSGVLECDRDVPATSVVCVMPATVTIAPVTAAPDARTRTASAGRRLSRPTRQRQAQQRDQDRDDGPQAHRAICSLSDCPFVGHSSPARRGPARILDTHACPNCPDPRPRCVASRIRAPGAEPRGTQSVRGSLRALPRRRRQRRRDGTADSPAIGRDERRAADDAAARGPPGEGDAAERAHRARRSPRWCASCATSKRACRRSSGRRCRPPTGGRSKDGFSARGSTTCSSGPTTGACTCCGGPAIASVPVTSDVSWPTYNGDPGGNRYTTLTQIDKTNVARLAPHWIFSMPGRRPAAGHARRRRRDHVRHRGQRVLRARCRHRPAALALQAPTDDRCIRAVTPTAASASPAIASS